MDTTEDLSARVLLKNVLYTEAPRTPVTRSTSQAQRASSGARRSSRLSGKDAGAQTPQQILRRSLKHKLRESASRMSLPPSNVNRRTTLAALRKSNTHAPATASLLCDEGVTPRHLLRNILQTEPESSMLLQEKAVRKEPQLPSANSSMNSNRPSTGLSELDLPDLTVANTVGTVRGLKRKRPRRSLNITAFEKRLKDSNDDEKEDEESADDLSSLSSSLSSSATLSLKTPFVDVRTEKRGLQRKIPNRRKITIEEFGAGIHKRQMGGDPGASIGMVERALSETAVSEGFTLGLSDLIEPDLTTDIVNHNTALYAQPETAESNLSIVATQDKPTVMASQLQRDMGEVEHEDAAAEIQTDEGNAAMKSQTEEEEAAAESQTDEDDAVVTSQSEEEEEAVVEDAGAVESQSEVEAVVEDAGAVESQSEEEEESEAQDDDVVKSQSEDEERGSESQTEDDDVAKSQSEDEEDAAESQTDEESAATESPPEKKEIGAESETDENDATGRSEPVEEEAVSESQTDEEDDGKREGEDTEQATKHLPHVAEHISRRAYRSVGGFIMPFPEAEWSGKFKRHSAGAMYNNLDLRNSMSHPHGGIHDFAPYLPEGRAGERPNIAEPSPDVEIENMSHLQLSEDLEDSKLLSADPEQNAAQSPAHQEEEWEDEEGLSDVSEELSMKTPAFVREKRNFFTSDPLASPTVLKNIETSVANKSLPAAKPKKVRAKRTGPAKMEPGLPKNYLMGVFRHFAKTKVAPDVYPVLKEIMDKFFDRLAEDLEAYALHAKRKTIEVEDVELLLKRQGHVNDKVPVEVLIEKYLPMEYRKLLIPIATSGNVVIPKQRR
ncbi:centromere protein T [Myripristis murdjan]|uniref:CENP-T/Histone H4 histone fold domain-containing protein n=1 Tax=Myripristis murdjan TaxID=586833 RepID=A0A668AL16_9TELE|nr:centromere protein T [Myripristis murdjan]